MSDYKEIKGKTIQYIGTDPSETSTEGQVWYNSAAGAFKSLLALEAWSSGANMINARYTLDSGIGASQSDAIGAGGYGTTSSTEEYNGSGWTSGGNLNTARYYGVGGGIQTAAWVAGGVGFPPNGIIANTENYDGSSWTSSGSLPTATRNAAATGSQTAGLLFGGNTPTPPAIVDATYEYNGSTWTANPTGLNTARRSLGSAGTQTSALAFGGDLGPPSNSDATEEYDGSTWTSANNLPGFQRAAGSGGTQTSAIYMGGDRRPSGLAKSTTTVVYDGTNWTTTANMGTGRYEHGGAAANNSAAVAFGGYITAATAVTEEYNKSTNVITAAAWSSLSNFPDSRAYGGGSGGTPTSTIVFTGTTGPGFPGFVSSGAEWDGSSWTAMGNYPAAFVGVAGLGPITAGLGAGGYKQFVSGTNQTEAYEYDGSTWTATNPAQTTGQGAKMTGVQTAALMGNRSGGPSSNESYDGTSWTTTNPTLAAGSAGSLMAGTQTAALMYGAESPPETRTESWDGTSWTSLSPLNTGRRQGSHGGTQTSAILGGGDLRPSGGVTAQTELWDGTSWVTSVNMGTARFYQVGGSSTGASGVTSNIAATGANPSPSNAVEEFSAETSALNLKTLTTS